MPKRVQSPSSINVYKQCPRRYFYQYILKLPTKPSIHLVRGSIVHEILENFFSLDPKSFDESDFRSGFLNYVSAYMIKLWKKNEKRLHALKMLPQELEFYLVDSTTQLRNFVEGLCEKLKGRMEKGESFEQAFKELTPSVEEEIKDEELSVKGFIDAIHEHDNEVIIMDYKTSKKDELTEGYRLQLAIYALLYKNKYGKAPNRVGINFLKFGEKTLEVDESLIEYARKEILFIHEHTESQEIGDYDQNVTPLCKWSNGQCDFYDVCKPHQNN